jgi:hypothetical protein
MIIVAHFPAAADLGWKLLRIVISRLNVGTFFESSINAKSLQAQKVREIGRSVCTDVLSGGHQSL